PDSSTAQQALDIVKKYNLTMTPAMIELLEKETPKVLDNVETTITGSVRRLCDTAATVCRGLGYRPILLSTSLCCVAREAGSFMASIARTHARDGEALAFIAGGETVVNITGKGLGGRNQELALSAAEGIDGLDNVAVFSVGSDGTDGPTDAAGGYADGTTQRRLREQGISIFDTLRQNDSYHALELCGGLVITGATGTNVNDLSVLLIRR
ncbi:MAG: MOFRL family protein, partial [Angelakisella sp.]